MVPLPVVPVLGLGGLGVLNHLGRQEVPVLVELAGFHLLVVNEDLVGLVGVHDQGVEMGEDVILAPDILNSGKKGVLK